MKIVGSARHASVRADGVVRAQTFDRGNASCRRTRRLLDRVLLLHVLVPVDANEVLRDRVGVRLRKITQLLSGNKQSRARSHARPPAGGGDKFLIPTRAGAPSDARESRSFEHKMTEDSASAARSLQRPVRTRRRSKRCGTAFFSTSFTPVRVTSQEDFLARMSSRSSNSTKYGISLSVASTSIFTWLSLNETSLTSMGVGIAAETKREFSSWPQVIMGMRVFTVLEPSTTWTPKRATRSRESSMRAIALLCARRARCRCQFGGSFFRVWCLHLSRLA